MSDEIIINQLKNRELQLMNELNKVQLALRAFINDNISVTGAEAARDTNIPRYFDRGLTYGGKILYVLSQSEKPLMVDEIAFQLHQLEPELDTEKLHKSVSHNVSMLAKYSRVRKHPFNRKIKYSL